MPRSARRVLGALLGWVVRGWVSTLRIRVVYDGWEPSSVSAPWVLAFLHGQQMALLAWRRRRGTLVMVSLSDDGELQSGVMAVQGLAVARGSTSRGGARAFASVVRALRRDGVDAAFAVDGPRGPLGLVQPGAARAARRAKGVLVPMASASASRWVLEGTWDRFEIPLPFSRVAVVLGAPLGDSGEDPGAIAAALSLARGRAVSELLSR